MHNKKHKKIIGLVDCDQTNYPNLALMKLSAFYKKQGAFVEWFSPLKQYDVVYASNVFTWINKNPYFPKKTIIGGTGSKDIKKTLPNEIEHICPDYSLYNCNKSYGFTTRGCPNKCKWCFVPMKEGAIKEHADIGEFLQHNELVLMDNNILAHNHGIHQLEKISKLNIKLDCNQGIDARLIDKQIAKLFSKIKWNPQVRLACDSHEQIKYIKKAVELLRWYNVTPRQYFIYVLMNDDFAECVERVKILRGLHLRVFVQPYRPFKGTKKITKEQKDFARWACRPALSNKIAWDDYKKIKSKKGLLF